MTLCQHAAARPLAHVIADVKQQFMDPSLKPDPNRKGSYYRRIEDVARGLDSLESGKVSATIRFFIYYFGCEKIARGLVGIHSRRPATEVYHHRHSLKLSDIKAAASTIGLTVPSQDLDWIFADIKEQHLLQSTPSWTTSARCLRNNATHDFGPSNVARVTEHAPFHIPKMEAVLASVPTILEYQRRHFAGVP
jgi:hypothetical protein